MNNVWSTLLQTKETLYQTRQLRFDDRFRDSYIDAFDLGERSRILEIGAGPGALTQALRRWYPDKHIVGSDRDTGFVDFARSQTPDIEFVEADATALPFADGSFDVTISNTVQEHVAPEKFFGEQYRVLSEGGICIVLSARRGISAVSGVVAFVSEFERELLERTERYYAANDERYGVGKYACTEPELLRTMCAHGFRDVRVSYLTVNLTPDSAQYEQDFALKMIEANRRVHLDSLAYLPNIAPGVVSDRETEQWAAVINEKYDKRIAQYKNGEQQWDANVSMTMVVRGVRR